MSERYSGRVSQTRGGQTRGGQTAVIFISRRNAADAAGYAEAAAAMDALAACQPGYRGVESVRGADGTGITISFWADAADAIAWRAHPDHAGIRESGRAIRYDAYEVAVAGIDRSYAWERG